MSLPQLPAPTKEFISYVASNPGIPIRDLLAPYNTYEAKLREIYAQSVDDEAIKNAHVNAVPIYAGNEENLKVRARDTTDEMENSKYIVPLKEGRKESGSPAMVESLRAFKKNFNLFSESSLADLNWNNVIVAGSAVVNSLLPLAKEHGESTRALRTYYHEELAPSSDVDLFLWGLTEEQAIQKIKDIEKSVKDSILAETTTIRTKNTITIASQYPTRHVQIVLRLYKSVSEILTGFDVDSSCFAYDGSQVYGTPRGIAAFLTQCNTVDLSRRSPSYENRLFKYAKRGFEIYCPDLERTKIDPTIYERAFARVQGLARLLVLERLPKESDREQYRDQRRQERARPAIPQMWKYRNAKLRDNFKDKDPQDIAEWVMEEQDDVSNYHTFTIPYGPRYNAKKIEKLVYTKDLLLNAEWNNKGERTVNLHRHPCFVGDVEYVISDCCKACPVPQTEEEKTIAAEESKNYISGDIEFLKDDPGRQKIGSFNPLTSEDWTDQAYLGNTESLCHAIVNCDLNFVEEWCSAYEGKLDQRDHTGRTPLQLATQIGSADMVKILVDSGARLVARLADGLTALHIACINGNTEIINILLEKSEANEELEAKKEEEKIQDKESLGSDDEASLADSYDELVDSEDEANDRLSMTQGSFVKVKSILGNEETSMEEEEADPDIYDVNVLAWDAAVSPLHLAVIYGHTEAIKLLINKFGADVLLPVKRFDEYNQDTKWAILALVLAARNSEHSLELTKELLDLGASPFQSDMNQFSALHSAALLSNVEVVKTMMERDLTKAMAALNHIIVNPRDWYNKALTPLTTLIGAQESRKALELLKLGVNPTIPFDDWAKAFVAAEGTSRRPAHINKATVMEKFSNVRQPVIDAAEFDLPAVVEALLDAGVDIDQLNTDGLILTSKSSNHRTYNCGKSLLDIIESKANASLPRADFVPAPDPPKIASDECYLQKYKEGTYQYWQIQTQVALRDEILQNWQNLKEEHDLSYDVHSSGIEIEEAKQLREHYRQLKTRLLAAGAKTFEELHPNLYPSGAWRKVNSQDVNKAPKTKSSVEERQLSIDFMVPGVHEKNTGRYAELFEAAWQGDKEKIKNLTTKPDADGNYLKIAVHDNLGIAPFHIAIWNGNHDLAELILEIAHIQFAPTQTNSKRRYYIRNEHSNCYETDSDDSASECNDFSVSSELVDQEFTIDDVANLASQTGSRTAAAKFLFWPAPFDMLAGAASVNGQSALENETGFKGNLYTRKWRARKTAWEFLQDCFHDTVEGNKTDVLQFAIDTGNIPLFKLFLKWANIYRPLLENYDSIYAKSHLLSPGDNRYLFRALERGHFNFASELISNFGGGMPVGSLAKDAGIQDPEFSKYYQGLLLRGKHKQEWAKEANKTANNHGPVDSLKTPLLLQSVGGKSVAAVEWCLSDTPARLLKLWLKNNKDEQVQKFAEIEGGFDKIAVDWLNSRKNLAIHMAVLSNRWEAQNSEDRTAVADILKYLIRVLPESIETKNVSGHTPLSLAVWTGRLEAASILISAGANQATRDYSGSNIVHLAINQIKPWTEENLETLDETLAMIDKRIIKSLFVERCSRGPTGMTPLATWLWRHEKNNLDDENKTVDIELLKILLKYMDRESLSMLDSAGQMPIHLCVKQNLAGLLDFLCGEFPELVLLENGMGQTALELCSSIYTRDIISGTSCPSELFVNRNLPLRGRPFEDPPSHSKALKVLQKAQNRVGDKKRVLVSSLQASEVAKRLVDAKKKNERIGYSSYRRWENQVNPQDEVEKWLLANSYVGIYID